MSKVKFYMFAASPPCRSVHMTAKALGLPLDIKVVDLPNKEHLGAEFTKDSSEALFSMECEKMEMNNGTPSRAIMRYLVLKYGGENNSLYPRDLQKRAVIDRLLDHDLGVFYRGMLDNVGIPARQGIEPTEEQKEKAVKIFEWLDNEVKGKKFLTGNDITIADFSLAAGFTISVLYKPGLAKYDHANAWFKRLQELPYFKEVNDFFYKFIETIAAKK